MTPDAWLNVAHCAALRGASCRSSPARADRELVTFHAAERLRHRLISHWVASLAA
jgi:hypothetical protein